MSVPMPWTVLLAVDVGRGELHWGWSQGMNQQQLVPIFEQWTMDGVVWDGAPSHRDKLMGQLGFGRISLPAYSPELNPAERVFEEVRRRIEGKVYPSLRGRVRNRTHTSSRSSGCALSNGPVTGFSSAGCVGSPELK